MLSIKKLVIKNGADLVGVADLKRLKGLPAFPGDLLETFCYGISLAVN